MVNYTRRAAAYWNCCLIHPRRAASLGRLMQFSCNGNREESFQMKMADNFESWKLGLVKKKDDKLGKKGSKKMRVEEQLIREGVA